MLECSILGLAQNMSFEDDEMVTQAIIRLSDGSVIRAVIDDDAAARLVALNVETRGQTRPSPPPRPEAGPGMDLGMEGGPTEAFGEPTIFGGDGGDTSADVLDDTPVVQTPAVRPPPMPPTVVPETGPGVAVLPSGKRIVISRSVPAGAGGYPVTPTNGVDPERTVPLEHEDDGTSSV